MEVYRDAGAHAAHMKTDWVTESIAQSRRLVEGKFNTKQYVSSGAEPAVRQMKES
jgi:quinol monooxygenase YgiN